MIVDIMLQKHSPKKRLTQDKTLWIESCVEFFQNDYTNDYIEFVNCDTYTANNSDMIVVTSDGYQVSQDGQIDFCWEFPS